MKINIYTTPERPIISSLNINTGNIKIIKLKDNGRVMFDIVDGRNIK